MSEAVKKLLDQILALSEEDRRWLSEALLESLEPMSADLRAAWNRAAIERVDEIVAGAELVSHAEARARARALLEDD